MMELKKSVQTCTKRPNIIRTITIALVVGNCLVIINQFQPLVHGPRTIELWLRIGLDYLVPFTVSNLGVLSGSRHAQP